MATIKSVQSGDYHTASTWTGGVVPSTTDRVEILAGDTVTWEGDLECGDGTRQHSLAPSVANGQLVIYGILRASRTVDCELKVKGLVFARAAPADTDGVVDFGTEADPIPTNVNLTIHTNYENSDLNGYYHWIHSNNGGGGARAKIWIMSAHYRNRNTTIVGVTAPGDTSFTVDDATGWTAGDKLYLAPKHIIANSSSRSFHEGDEAVIASVAGNVVTVTAPLTYAHGYLLLSDYGAAGVSNFTSNIKITGPGDSSRSYGTHVYRAQFQIENVEWPYMNNRYNYHSSVRIQDAANNTQGLAIFRNNAIWCDGTNIADNMEGMLTFYTPRHLGNGPAMVFENLALSMKAMPGRANSGGVYTYYGGRLATVKNLSLYGVNRYISNGLNSYQCPTIFQDCKVFNAHIPYNMHNNVLAEARNCWAVGFYFGMYGYNGTALYTDHHLRWGYKLAQYGTGWRYSAESIRLEFEDVHVQHKGEEGTHYNSVPDGNSIKYIDMQGDPTQNREAQSFGQVARNYTYTKNDDFSLELYAKDETIPVRLRVAFPTEVGKVMPVSAFIRNISPDYEGVLTLRLVQDGATLVEKVYTPLTDFTLSQWSLVNLTGVAVSGSDTTLEVDFTADFNKLALTDILLPPTASEISQANAVWSYEGRELTEGTRDSEIDNINTIVGLLQTGMDKANKILGWLRSLL